MSCINRLARGSLRDIWPGKTSPSGSATWSSPGRPSFIYTSHLLRTTNKYILICPLSLFSLVHQNRWPSFYQNSQTKPEDVLVNSSSPQSRWRSPLLVLLLGDSGSKIWLRWGAPASRGLAHSVSAHSTHGRKNWSELHESWGSFPTFYPASSWLDKWAEWSEIFRDRCACVQVFSALHTVLHAAVKHASSPGTTERPSPVFCEWVNPSMSSKVNKGQKDLKSRSLCDFEAKQSILSASSHTQLTAHLH